MSDKKISENRDKSTVLRAQESPMISENNHDKTTNSATEETNTEEKRSFSDRWKNNRFWLIRATYHVLRTIWIVVMAIGAFIAWLISLLFI